MNFESPPTSFCSKSNCRAPAVDGEIGAIDEAGLIACQKADGLSDLVGCGWPARGSLGRQLIECLTHRLRACLSSRLRAYRSNAVTPWTVFGSASLRHQIEGRFALRI